MKLFAATILALSVSSAFAWGDDSGVASSSSTSKSGSEATAGALAGSTAFSGGSGAGASVSQGDTRMLSLPSTGNAVSTAMCGKYTHWGIGWNLFYLHTGGPDMECIDKIMAIRSVREATPVPPVVNYIYNPPVVVAAPPPVVIPPVPPVQRTVIKPVVRKPVVPCNCKVK